MKKKVNKKELHKAIVEFEKQFGSTAFLKAVLSVLNRILVDKGLVTKDALLAYYEDELKLVSKKLTTMALERHKLLSGNSDKSSPPHVAAKKRHRRIKG